MTNEEKIPLALFDVQNKKIFIKIDGCLSQMEKQKQLYFDNINNRVSVQNEADIRRKNLEEVKEKLDLFERHNMQVELWEKYYACMEEKLVDMLNYTSKDGLVRTDTEIKTEAVNLRLEEMPHLPETVCSKFRSMKVTLSQGQKYENTTCFLKNLHLTIINNS